MADRTGIEWTDATWQVTHGCTILSPGCAKCYAMRMAARLERIGHPDYIGLTDPSRAGAVWNGTVREADLGASPLPLRWKRPRRIFVNSMSDLFHDAVSSDHIANVFGIMACAQQHIFQVLTKRSERMASLLATDRFWRKVWSFAAYCSDQVTAEDAYWRAACCEYGLPNVWLGVSVEDQARADERIPDLLDTPAAVRFLSCEPLLGPIDLRPRPKSDLCIRCGEGPEAAHDHPDGYRTRGLDWVIAGGESGPGARPMHPDWVRGIRDQCQGASVPFFFKQWDGMRKKPTSVTIDGREWREFPCS